MHNTHTPVFLRALSREDVPVTPIWLMRQAGRYLPEYRALRKQVPDFMTFCQTPEMALQATLQPIDRFNLDAAIIFSDILTIPGALNLGLKFIEGHGPCFAAPIRDLATIQNLPSSVIINELSYVMQAISLTRAELPAHIPLIGFAGSPWTLACYMVEGGGSKDFANIKTWLYRDDAAIDLLLTKLTAYIIDYLKAQIAAGANALMLFDTWGGILPYNYFLQYSLKHLHTIVQAVQLYAPHIPIILFSKGSQCALPKLAATGCQALSIDWMCDFAYAYQAVGAKVALQGNLDPQVLLGKPDTIVQEVERILQVYGSNPGHIFNLGHGILPEVPVDNVYLLVESVRTISQKMRQRDSQPLC